jgi:hypothetical protein
MGVVNAAVVGMGVLIAGVNVMGVWWAGLEGMGPHRLGASPTRVHQHQDAGPPAGEVAPSPTVADQVTFPTREEALQKASELGCRGVHRMGPLWMPCDQHPTP